ncbi:DDE_3 domain-containing protein [Trichonephila clavipes]|nr:DDE_3 domain-containing protein [Trichonephila clavipes]
MEWPARSPDLNPIEHLWDYFGREVAALNPPPRSLHELKQGLLCVWSSLPIPVSDNLINSMGNRCRQCIQVGRMVRERLQVEVAYTLPVQDLTFDDYMQVGMNIAVWETLSDAEIVALGHNNTESDEDESE